MSFILAESQCVLSGWSVKPTGPVTAQWGQSQAHLLMSVTRSRFYSLHYPTYYTPFIQLDGYLNPAGEYNDTFLVAATNLDMNWALLLRKQIINDVQVLN